MTDTLALQNPQLRVLMRTATTRDAVMASAVLSSASIETQVCADLPELLRAVGEGAGAGTSAGVVGADVAAIVTVGRPQRRRPARARR